MSDEKLKPSQRALANLLQRINLDEQIPTDLKARLSEAIEPGDSDRILEIRSLLVDWADSHED